MKAPILPFLAALSACAGAFHGAGQHKLEQARLADVRELERQQEEREKEQRRIDESRLTAMAEQELHDELVKAEQHILAGEYGPALAIGLEVQKKLGPIRSEGAAQIRRELGRVLGRSRLYRGLTKDIEAHDFLKGDVMSLRLVQLADGTPEFVAKVLKTNPDGVVLEFGDKTEQLFQTAEVKAIDVITQEKYKSRVREFILRRGEQLASSEDVRPLEYYRLAHTCFQHGLTPEGVRLLDRAVDMDGSEVLLLLAEGSEELRESLLLAAGDAQVRDAPIDSPGGDPSPAPEGDDPIDEGPEPLDTDPTDPGDPEVVVVRPPPVGPVPSGPSVRTDPQFETAKGYFATAMTHYRKALRSPSSASGQKNLRAAAGLLEKALDIYNALFEKFPDDGDLEQEAYAAQQMLYDCNKSTGLK